MAHCRAGAATMIPGITGDDDLSFPEVPEYDELRVRLRSSAFIRGPSSDLARFPLGEQA